MSHLRSGFSGVSVPIGADGSSHNTITNNVVIKTEKKPQKNDGVQEVSDGVYVVYPNKKEGEDPNPYASLNTRDLESAQTRLNEIKAQQPENEKLIQALSLIIDMLYNNPVYVNKLVVPELDNLRQLVKLLTDADEVDITLADPTCECGCSGNSSKLSRVDSIYVKKGASILEFKYAYAEAKQILEVNHISTKWVALG